MNKQLTQEELAVIAKVEKLLALSKNNDNEHQASAASAKAMELLALYNLDMANLGTSGKGAQRSDTRLRGGLYQWQREIWNAVALTNFCVYRSIRGLERGSVYEHRVIGSHVNVTSTKVMADYLQQTVERLAQQWANDRGYRSVFVKEAIAYREGMAERLCNRLWDLRMARAAEGREQQKYRESNPSDGKSLILADVIQTEQDLNDDYLYGYEPGTTARHRAENAAHRARALAEAARLLVERDAAEAANPALKEARLKREAIEAAIRAKADAEWERKWNRRSHNTRERQETPREARRRMGSYQTGYSDGADIGLDKQVDAKTTRRIT